MGACASNAIDAGRYSPSLRSGEGAGGEEQTGAAIYHLFDTTFDQQQLDAERETVVVGGGITAAQFALSLAVRNPGKVILLTRHAPRLHQFDADLGWITHRYMDGFLAETDYTKRRAMIQAARHRGSMPADVARELERALELGLVVQRIDEVDSVSADGTLRRCRPYSPHWVGTRRIASAGSKKLNHDMQDSPHALSLHLASGVTLNAGQIVLATGFASDRPGGAWLNEAIHTYGLPTAPDGYPLVDTSLCWWPGLYVCGSLAELEVGPVARNLVGVKLAAERIGAVL